MPSGNKICLPGGLINLDCRGFGCFRVLVCPGLIHGWGRVFNPAYLFVSLHGDFYSPDVKCWGKVVWLERSRRYSAKRCRRSALPPHSTVSREISGDSLPFGGTANL